MKRSFFRARDGFVLILSLLLLPVFFTFALLIIDASRGNNAHGDLQAAADALALAAARELDGEPGAIADAHLAMEEIINNVSMLARNSSNGPVGLPYTTASGTDAFDVVFLEDIPADDTTPLQSVFAASATTVDEDAAYVYVAARSTGLQPMFHRILNLSDDVPVGAWAVATHTQAACQVVPIMICNPFESEGTTYDVLLDAFNQGKMQGRMLRLIKNVGGGGGPGVDPVGPGNWGYLSTYGSGGNVLRAALAGYNPVCYSGNTVDTKPGATTSVSQGYNTRHGLYSGSYNNTQSQFPPDVNLENYTHLTPPGNGNSSPGDFAWDNEVMVVPADGIAGAFIGQEGSGWNLRGECRTPTTGAGTQQDPYVKGTIEFRGTTGLAAGESFDLAADTCTYNDAGGASVPGTWWPGYWEVKHQVAGSDESWDQYLSRTGFDIVADGIRRVLPNEPAAGPGFPDNLTIPSRFDIYEWELAQGLEDAPSGGLSGLGTPGRRELFTAIVNCKALTAAGFDFNGQTNDVPVVTYASVFSTSPMEGSQDGIDFEVTDLVGFTGSTALNEKFREESMLVR